MKKLAIIHTTSATIEPLHKLANELLPGTIINNWMDDSILPELIASNGNLLLVRERWIQYVRYAIQADASVVLSACSSVGDLADEIQERVSIPVLRIDRPMAEEAVSTANRIGVAATISVTLGPTTRLLHSIAATRGKEVRLYPLLVEGAYAQMMAGHPEIHDRLLADALVKLIAEVDLVILAQASMARVIPTLPIEIQSRFLTSPRSGMQNIALVLNRSDG